MVVLLRQVDQEGPVVREAQVDREGLVVWGVLKGLVVQEGPVDRGDREGLVVWGVLKGLVARGDLVGQGHRVGQEVEVPRGRWMEVVLVGGLVVGLFALGRCGVVLGMQRVLVRVCVLVL